MPVFLIADVTYNGGAKSTLHAALTFSLSQAWFPSHAELWNAPTWFLSADIRVCGFTVRVAFDCEIETERITKVVGKVDFVDVLGEICVLLRRLWVWLF